MGREVRIEIPEGVYHVISRSIDERELFKERNDYKKFIKLLEDSCNKFDVSVFSYALMINHTHLLIQTHKANLSKFMHKLNSSYAHYFNKKYLKKGHLFQDRYKSFIIKNDRYLLAVARYINLNPVDAGVVKFPEDYEWSSFRYFLNTINTKSKEKHKPSFLDINRFFELIPIEGEEFVRFVSIRDESSDSLFKGIFEGEVNLQKVFEIKSMLDTIKREFKGMENNRRLRNTLIYFFMLKGYKNKEIAKAMDLSSSTVTRVCRKMANDKSQIFANSTLIERFNKICNV